MRQLAVIFALVVSVLALASAALAHSGGHFTNRFSAQIQARQVLSEDYGWFVMNLRCGGPGWVVGRHFPCTFTRLGRRYIVCYHSLDSYFGIVTNYNRYTCTKYY